MTLDHSLLAEIVTDHLKGLVGVASVTAIQDQGVRNPVAKFTVIGVNGSVLQVSIKRLMKGQELPIEQAPTKPKARKAPAKRKASKK